MKVVGSSQQRLFAMRCPRAPLRLFAVFIALTMMISAPVAESFAADPVGVNDRLLSKLNRRGDLTLSDSTLRQALFTISESWEINLVVADEVEGKVNGVFKNAPLHEILHSILFANGFGYRVVGSGLVVMPLSTLGDSNPMFESATITLQAVSPEELMAGAKLLSSPQGKVQALISARSLLVVDLPERVAKIRDFALQIDQAALRVAGGVANHAGQLQFAQYTLQYTRAEWIQEAVQTTLSKEGKVTVVLEENRLVVVDYPPALNLVRQLIEQLDVPRPQVRITALIYDISISDLNRLGINWNHALKGDITNAGTADQLFSIDSLLQLPAAASDPSGVMTFMSLNRNFDLTAVIDALSTADDSQLLADPSVIVTNYESASIQIVTEIPFQQLTQTSAGGNIGTTAFRNAGVSLEVVPQIANDGTILLSVMPSFSRLTGFTAGANPQPIIDKREAQTTVRVADRQTLVIGGLRQRTELNNFTGLPYLKDIKLLNIGKLFQSKSTTIRESELVVFIRPEIVTPLYAGEPREQAAYHYGRNLLERIPLPEADYFPLDGSVPHGGEFLIEEVPQPPHPEVKVLPLPPPSSSENDTTRNVTPREYRTAAQPKRDSGRAIESPADLRNQVQRIPSVDNEAPQQTPLIRAAPPQGNPRPTSPKDPVSSQPDPPTPKQSKKSSQWLNKLFRL